MQHVPCGLEGQVLCGHHFGHFGCPACKLITLTLGSFGSGDGAAVSYRSGGIYHVVPLEGQGVIVHIPCGIVGETAYRNGGAFYKFRIPACEGVAFLDRVSGLGDNCAVVERLLVNGYAVNHKLHGVLQHVPCSVEHEVTVGHGLGHFLCPACKLITLTGRSIRKNDGCAIVESHRFDFRTAVGVERDGVAVHCPCGSIGDAAYRNGGTFYKFRIPACEGVAFLGGVFGLGDYRSVVERLGGLHAVNVKGHVILDGLEVGHEGKVSDSCKGIGVVG